MSIILEPQTYSGGDFRFNIRGAGVTLEDFRSAIENILVECPTYSLVGNLLVLNTLKPGQKEYIVTVKIQRLTFWPKN